MLPSGPMLGGRDVHPLLSADEIAARVRELARDISTDYAGKQPLVVGVLKGAWIFMADLVRHLTIPVRCDFVVLSSYGMNTVSSGAVQLRLDLAISPRGQDVLVVEDIVDTGTSLPWLLDHLRQQQPASIKVCTLLDKPARRQVALTLDYVGFTIPDKFVVGYGIDCGERHRELPCVACIAEEARSQNPESRS